MGTAWEDQAWFGNYLEVACTKALAVSNERRGHGREERASCQDHNKQDTHCPIVSILVFRSEFQGEVRSVRDKRKGQRHVPSVTLDGSHSMPKISVTLSPFSSVRVVVVDCTQANTVFELIRPSAPLKKLVVHGL